MFRLCLAFVMLPALVLADEAPRPQLFSYQAAFDACTLDPDTPDLASLCDIAITDAYLLRRAVTRATVACAETPLGFCDLPFEDEGLPAIAMHIAVGAGCDTDSLTSLPDGARLDDNHCIALAADIMEEEGVVPLDTTLDCNASAGICAELLEAQSRIWLRAIADLSDTNLTSLRTRIALEGCQAGDEITSETYACHLPRLAAIWAELAQIEQEY